MVWLWVGFFVLVLALLALDLGVFNRDAHVIGMREAIGWTIFWIALSLCFNVGVYLLYEHRVMGAGAAAGRDGATAGVEFLTGYLIEKSLSVDNIFVMALVFRYFRIPPQYQHRVLFWGILGALVTRGTMIGLGVWLVNQFDWVFYVFGAFLIYSGGRMLLEQDEDLDPERSAIVRWARRAFRVSPHIDGQKFTTRVDGAFAFTPLMLVLVVIETADIVFAVDSIPAIFAITTDPFIVLTSNVFAILGLRAMYFVLAGVIDRFRYLSFTLTLILVFVGIKMLLHAVYPIDNVASLLFIASTLLVGVFASVAAERRDGKREP